MHDLYWGISAAVDHMSLNTNNLISFLELGKEPCILIYSVSEQATFVIDNLSRLSKQSMQIHQAIYNPEDPIGNPTAISAHLPFLDMNLNSHHHHLHHKKHQWYQSVHKNILHHLHRQHKRCPQ